MMHKLLVCLLTGSMMLFSITTQAAEIDISCPLSIQTTQKINILPEGYQSRVEDSSHYWERLTFYSGKPEDNASLAPDESTKKQQSWTFSGKEAVYLGCAYHQTAVELIRKLPANTKTCSAIFDLESSTVSGFLPTKIICNTR